MKPVYFPFTDIPADLGRAAARCVGPVTVYRPIPGGLSGDLSQLRDEKCVAVKSLETDDIDVLNALVQDYRNWAELHSGESADYFKAHKDWIPHFDESNPSRIRSEILRKKHSTADKPAARPDPLVSARVFLQIAQEFDIQNREVEQGVFDISKLEKDLMEAIQGEPAQAPGHENHYRRDDPGAFMPAERIAAWARLFLADPVPCDLLITLGTAMKDHLTDRMEDMNSIFTTQFPLIPEISAKPSNEGDPVLISFLERILTGDAPDTPEIPAGGSEPLVTLEIFKIPDISPWRTVNRLLQNQSRHPDSGSIDTDKPANTLIACFTGSK